MHRDEAASTPTIRDSWNRCRRAGLDPTRQPPLRFPPSLSGAKPAPALLDALPHVQAVYCGLAQTPCLLLLADDRATIAFGLASPQLRLAAARLGVLRGADWSEAARGTNAIALAQICAAPARVKDGEHFLDALKEWSGVAFPLGQEQGIVAL